MDHPDAQKRVAPASYPFSYSFDGLEPGAYAVVAQHSRYDDPKNPEGSELRSTEFVTVAAGATEHVDLQISVIDIEGGGHTFLK